MDAGAFGCPRQRFDCCGIYIADIISKNGKRDTIGFTFFDKLKTRGEQGF